MSATAIVARQRAASLAACRRHVGLGDHYALVDFPEHANVGDSAIWLGERVLLREITGRDPDYVCTWDGYDPTAFRDASPAGVLFLHGGGNVGDIWPHHQHFREQMIAEVRDRRVVQLPQSIHYRDPSRVAAFASAVESHPAFHLYVRDAASVAFAREHLACPVTLAPDSAFAIGMQRRAAPDIDTLMLIRSDDERVGHDRPAPDEREEVLEVDWLEDGELPRRKAGETRLHHYDRLAEARVLRGLALLSRGRRVVTDRLHGHILSMLLAIPHKVLDNEYGKLSRYIAAWTGETSLLAREPA